MYFFLKKYYKNLYRRILFIFKKNLCPLLVFNEIFFRLFLNFEIGSLTALWGNVRAYAQSRPWSVSWRIEHRRRIFFNFRGGSANNRQDNRHVN